ncbi:lytic murein transglycosylase [Deferribacteraceae bacterium V6Fe1]|nr:lytic murein transglycosylase [Deferribacteraceae bacterium V6Fe1]
MRFFVLLAAISFFIAQPIFAYDNLTEYISKRFNLPIHYVQNALAKAKIDFAVLEKIKNPAEEKDWEDYKKIFLNPQKVKNGQHFYKKYKKLLLKAEKKYRVPSEIIAAIIGIESDFGKYKPKYNALDSLYTLAEKFDRRSEYFTNELGSLLDYTYKHKIKPSEVLSSYAGAVGIPQFMPSNIFKFAVDFNKDKKIDLVNSMSDAIGSVANFLSKNGWDYGKPTAVVVKNVNSSITTYTKVSFLRKRGVIFPFNIKRGEAKINKIGQDYWATFKNFDVLRKYNPSDNYALSVLLLSKMIK